MGAFLSDTGILVAAVLFVALFGASQIPKLARNLGEAGREFRKAHSEFDAAATPTAPLPSPPACSDDRVTLTRSQYEALLVNPATPGEHRS